MDNDGDCLNELILSVARDGVFDESSDYRRASIVILVENN